MLLSKIVLTKTKIKICFLKKFNLQKVLLVGAFQVWAPWDYGVFHWVISPLRRSLGPTSSGHHPLPDSVMCSFRMLWAGHLWASWDLVSALPFSVHVTWVNPVIPLYLRLLISKMASRDITHSPFILMGDKNSLWSNSCPVPLSPQGPDLGLCPWVLS